MTPPPPDPLWSAAVARWAGAPVVVTGRTPLAGGYASGAVERVDLDADGRPLAVVVKRGGAGEVAAMRAIAVVAGVDRPRMLATGRDRHGTWLVLPFHPGPPCAEGDEVPSAVWEVLGRVHAHWHRRRPRGVPVVDAGWWLGMVTGHALPAVRGAHARTGDPRLAEAAELLVAWSTDERLRTALAVLPRTLTHGDAHRGNVLLDPDGAALIDWGNARVAPAGLDVATLAAQGAPAPAAYSTALGAAATPPPLAEVERLWARVQVHVQYLGFAADHLGTARVLEMVDTAARALDALGPALTDAAAATL